MDAQANSLQIICQRNPNLHTIYFFFNCDRPDNQMGGEKSSVDPFIPISNWVYSCTSAFRRCLKHIYLVFNEPSFNVTGGKDCYIEDITIPNVNDLKRMYHRKAMQITCYVFHCAAKMRWVLSE